MIAIAVIGRGTSATLSSTLGNMNNVGTDSSLEYGLISVFVNNYLVAHAREMQELLADMRLPDWIRNRTRAQEILGTICILMPAFGLSIRGKKKPFRKRQREVGIVGERAHIISLAIIWLVLLSMEE